MTFDTDQQHGLAKLDTIKKKKQSPQSNAPQSFILLLLSLKSTGLLPRDPSGVERFFFFFPPTAGGRIRRASFPSRPIGSISGCCGGPRLPIGATAGAFQPDLREAHCCGADSRYLPRPAAAGASAPFPFASRHGGSAAVATSSRRSASRAGRNFSAEAQQSGRPWTSGCDPAFAALISPSVHPPVSPISHHSSIHQGLIHPFINAHPSQRLPLICSSSIDDSFSNLSIYQSIVPSSNPTSIYRSACQSPFQPFTLSRIHLQASSTHLSIHQSSTQPSIQP